MVVVEEEMGEFVGWLTLQQHGRRPCVGTTMTATVEVGMEMTDVPTEATSFD